MPSKKSTLSSKPTPNLELKNLITKEQSSSVPQSKNYIISIYESSKARNFGIMSLKLRPKLTMISRIYLTPNLKTKSEHT